MTKTEAIDVIVENIAKAIGVCIRPDLYSKPFKEIIDYARICMLIRYFDTFAKIKIRENDSIDVLANYLVSKSDNAEQPTETKLPYEVINPEIYPPKVFMTSVLTKPEEIKVYFEYDNEMIPNGEFQELDKTVDACCYPVIEKSTHKHGILMICVDMPSDLFDVVSHESVHAADYFFDYCGCYSQSFQQRNEAYAYLVGWIAKQFGNFILKSFNCYDNVISNK